MGGGFEHDRTSGLTGRHLAQETDEHTNPFLPFVLTEVVGVCHRYTPLKDPWEK